MSSRLFQRVHHAFTLRPIRISIGVIVLTALAAWLLPDWTLGPGGLIKPSELLRLALMIMVMSTTGVIAELIVGPRLGATLAGFAGGFVSSSAVIASYGRIANNHTTASDAALKIGAASGGTPPWRPIASASASSIATFVQMYLLITISGPLLRTVAVWPMAGGAIAMALYTAVCWRASVRVPSERKESAPAELQPFTFVSVLAFVALVAAIGVMSGLIAERFGSSAVVLAATAAGFADAHATAASSASLFTRGGMTESAAMLSILAALTSNSVAKLVIAAVTGTRTYAHYIGLGVTLSAGAAWLTYLAQRWLVD